MMIPLVVIGTGFGMVVAPTIDLVLGQVPEHEAGAASGLLNTGQQLGVALGVALVGVVFFTQLDHGSARGAEDVVPQTRSELTALRVPGPVQHEILEQFQLCVRERSAQVDPSRVPESCQTAEPQDPAMARTLAAAGKQATAINFVNTFGHTLWYGAAGLLLVLCGFIALPQRVRPAKDDTETDMEEPALV